MSKIKKFGIIVLSVPLLVGLAYAIRNVRENYKTGDWSESCGTLFTNPHYRECKQRRTWIPRLDYDALAKKAGGPTEEVGPWTKYSEGSKVNQTIEIHGGETLRIVPSPHPSARFTQIAPLIYLGYHQKFALVCGNYGEQRYFDPELKGAIVSCP
jgi:hypothetical protein